MRGREGSIILRRRRRRRNDDGERDEMII